MSTSSALEEEHTYLEYSITYYAYPLMLIYSTRGGGWGAKSILYHADGKSPTRIDIVRETHHAQVSMANYA